MTSDWSILDWAYSKASDFRSRESTQGSIDEWAAANARDGGERWESFKRFAPDWIERTSKGGVVISDDIDDENKKYIEKLSAEIESADTPESLGKIKIDDSYEEDTQTTLTDALEKRKEELSVITVEIGGEIFEIPSKFERGRPRQEVRDIVSALAGEVYEDILTAETPDDLDDITIPTNVPQSVKSFLKSEIREARREL